MERKPRRRIQTSFSEEEYLRLKKKADEAGLAVPVFLRQAADAMGVRAALNADVPVLIHEVRAAGASLAKLVKIAEDGGMLEAEDLRKALADSRAAEKKIFRAYLR